MPPAVQTVYNDGIAIALPGQPAAPAWDADSRIVETVAGIGFGLVVSRGAGERGVILGGAQFAGISMKDITQPPGPGITDEYQRYDNIGVMTRGLIWVTVAADVEAGDNVFYNTTTGAISNAGGTQIADAVFESSALSGGLAKVKLAGKLPSIAAGT